MIAEKIKLLREKRNMTQTDVAKELGITRSSVNAWEMGISVPSTQYVIELAKLFGVSTDYLLGLDGTATVNVAGLSDRQLSAVVELISCFQEKQKCFSEDG